MKKEDIIKNMEEFKNEKITNKNELENIRIKYLGKKGIVTEYSKNMKNLSIEEKKNMGKLLMNLKH